MWWQKTKGVCEKIPLITNETEAHYSVSLSHLRVTVITALLQMYQKVQSNQKTQEHFLKPVFIPAHC